MEEIYPVEEQEPSGEEVPSAIQEYYSDSTIFVTGGTGFLGRLLIEKLLRTCHSLSKIYILMRAKKGKSLEERFKNYFEDIIFERLKREQPKSLKKLHPIMGDCEFPDLGLSDEDKRKLVAEVDVIFHAAATVRFDEKLRKAAHINVRGTTDLLRMAKTMKNLTSVVYVSTAMSFCPQQDIGEKFYKPLVTGKELLNLVETFNDDVLEAITPVVIEDWPNTYVFTKSVAEDVVRVEGEDLPIVLIRPSIVVGTAKEPIAGWIDNYYGATGIFVGASLGLIRTLHCKPTNIADIVPADYVTNCTIAAAWDIANTRFASNKEISEQNGNGAPNNKSNIPIYNYVSSPQKPINWNYCALGRFQVNSFVSAHQIWHRWFFLVPNKHVHFLLHYLLHIVPAYIVDFLAILVRRKPQMVKGYRKIEKFLDVTAYFSSREWNFENFNTQSLWKKLNATDRKLFEFDMGALDWDNYFYHYIKGCRVYLLKDPMDTLPQAVRKEKILKIAHYALLALVVLGFVRFLYFFFEMLM